MTTDLTDRTTSTPTPMPSRDLAAGDPRPTGGTLLGVWAHPDDECYLSGGLMAAAAARGDRVVCVTATRGEAGVTDESRWPAADLARIREGELAESLAVLGVEEHHWLDLTDGECATVDGGPTIDRLTSLIVDLEPSVVVTFGPDGITDHPDHKAVGGWTTEAFARAGLDESQLWYPTYPSDWEPLWGDELREIGVYPPGFPVLADRRDLVGSVAFSGELLDRKCEALRCQRSQVGGLIDALTLPRYRQFLADESFRLASTVLQPHHPTKEQP